MTPGPEAQGPSMRELFGYTDAELAQYVYDQLATRKRVVLPSSLAAEDELTKQDFTRLLDRIHLRCASELGDPLIAGLSKVDKILGEVPKYPNNRSLRFASPEGHESWSPESASDSDGEPEGGIYREVKAYYALIKQGGRPAYPLRRLAAVSRNPSQHEDLLTAWTKRSSFRLEWEVYQRQLKRWDDFREWQRCNRRIPDESDRGFAAFVVEKKKTGGQHMRILTAEEENDLRVTWEKLTKRRERRWKFLTEDGCHNFADYAASAKRRLGRHGITRHVELKEDAREQDEVTTWIEYANFEMWRLEKHSNDAVKHQQFIQAWWEWVGKQIELRDDDTPESVRRGDPVSQDEFLDAQDALARARNTQQTHLEAAAQERLKELDTRVATLRKFVLRTQRSARKMEHPGRHEKLVEWVAAQMPLVEAGPVNDSVEVTGDAVDFVPLEDMAAAERSPRQLQWPPSLPTMGSFAHWVTPSPGPEPEPEPEPETALGTQADTSSHQPVVTLPTSTQPQPAQPATHNAVRPPAPAEPVRTRRSARPAAASSQQNTEAILKYWSGRSVAPPPRLPPLPPPPARLPAQEPARRSARTVRSAAAGVRGKILGIYQYWSGKSVDPRAPLPQKPPPQRTSGTKRTAKLQRPGPKGTKRRRRGR